MIQRCIFVWAFAVFSHHLTERDGCFLWDRIKHGLSQESPLLFPTTTCFTVNHMGQPNLQQWHKIKELKTATSRVGIICNLPYFFLKKIQCRRASTELAWKFVVLKKWKAKTHDNLIEKIYFFSYVFFSYKVNNIKCDLIHTKWSKRLDKCQHFMRTAVYKWLYYTHIHTRIDKNDTEVQELLCLSLVFILDLILHNHSILHVCLIICCFIQIIFFSSQD